MMPENQEFIGLPMSVFTAFGWAGEEKAMEFALSQLEIFIKELHLILPRPVQDKLPVFGLNRESQTVYLAARKDVESGAHIIFNARPSSLEMQLVISDKKMLAKSLKLAEANPAVYHRLVTGLGADWSLCVQQMQVDEETGEAVHYQDLFKDDVTKLDEGMAVATMSKANYLNGDAQWVTPVYLSYRIPAEQIAAMGQAVIPVMSEHVAAIMPVFDFLTGQTKTKKKKAKAAAKAKGASRELSQTKEGDPIDMQAPVDPDDGFNYVAELKPLHIRRGFINMTAEQWPFFAVNSRTVTRPVTVYYNGIYDKKSAVWRLVPDDQARIVLNLPVRLWVEENFDAYDKIHIIVRRLEGSEIQISLKAV